jgi:hypothetical protein
VKFTAINGRTKAIPLSNCTNARPGAAVKFIVWTSAVIVWANAVIVWASVVIVWAPNL